jgi:hypothetical protein
MAKRKVFISNHGTFDQFGMNISLPAIIELTEEQIAFIQNTGLYKLEELRASHLEPPKASVLDIVDGDRFSRKRTISVNELTFKAPIMGTKYAKKAKGALVVKKGSIYEKQAIDQLTKHNADAQKQSNENALKMPDKLENASRDVTKPGKRQKGINPLKNSGLLDGNESFEIEAAASTEAPSSTEA